ncbi:MAG: hypothetical protein N3D11_00395 [Candidatus Sumerlaeia bacterium]|nr:hypothetical protein [Candidatus Sumerlaeia bacterium]
MKRVCVFLAGCLLAAGCSHFNGKGKIAGGPTLAALAQQAVAPAGYRAVGKPAFFNRDNLFEAIDGMAPEYISYGCKALAVLNWASLKSAEETIETHIYDMGSALGAFGIYSRTHVGEGGEFLDIGEEAAVAEDSIEFARGRYFVKMSSAAEGARSALESAARSLVAKIPAGPPLNELLAGLPSEGRVPRSERWVPDAAFGMEFMRDVLVARYKVGERTVEVHRAPFADLAAAQKALEAFRAAVKDRSPKDAAEAFSGFFYEDQWMGTVGVFQIETQIVVVVGYQKDAAVADLLQRFAGAAKR